MRNMKKVQYEELSDDQIAAARRRRSREVALDSAPDIDDIELPDNHPFAFKQSITPGEPRRGAWVAALASERKGVRGRVGALAAAALPPARPPRFAAHSAMQLRPAKP
jgi:hypothetical protein